MPSILDNSKHPEQSPYFHALNADRYARQALISSYEELTGRRLIVFIGTIHRTDIAPFIDLLSDVKPQEPLDLLLTSSGGDGETALRLIRLCRQDRTDFRVIVPDEAKSASTLLALGAEQIVMSTSSDLGPIDPQVFLPNSLRLIPAKIVVEIVDDLESRLFTHPEAYPLYLSLLAEIDASLWKMSKSILERTEELVREVTKCLNEPVNDIAIKNICKALSSTRTHEAVVGFDDAQKMGLPVIYWASDSEEWQSVWRLYARYHVLTGADDQAKVFESRQVSYVRTPYEQTQPDNSTFQEESYMPDTA